MNLLHLRLLIVGSLVLPLQALSCSGVRLVSPSRTSKVTVRSNLFPTRSNLPDKNSLRTSVEYRQPTALAASSVPPIGLVGHVGIMSIATLVVKRLYRSFFLKEDEPSVGVMERCPWPFVFFHDPKQGLKDTPTWITLLYIIIWRCVKAYQAFKLSG